MRLVLLLVAAVIAIVAGVAALKLSGGNEPEPTPTVAVTQPANTSTVDVLVAREQINVGTVITPEMITRQPWPSHLVLESFVVSDGRDENTIGKVARATFMPYEPLMKTRLGNPNDPSFLAASLPAGMRAMTLATDVISGVAGYVFPGDRVDVLVTHNVPAEMRKQKSGSGMASGSRPAYAEVLVSDARVLAVNLRPAEGANVSTSSNTAPNSITLEVPESVAQELRLAEKLGTLSLTLRSLKDMDNKEVPLPSTYEDLTRAGSVSSGGPGVRVVRGTDAGKEYEPGNYVEDDAETKTMSPEEQSSVEADMGTNQ